MFGDVYLFPRWDILIPWRVIQFAGLVTCTVIMFHINDWVPYTKKMTTPHVVRHEIRLKCRLIRFSCCYIMTKSGWNSRLQMCSHLYKVLFIISSNRCAGSLTSALSQLHDKRWILVIEAMRLQQVGRIEDAPHLPTTNLSIPTHPTKNHFWFDNESHKTPLQCWAIGGNCGSLCQLCSIAGRGAFLGGCHVLAEHVPHSPPLSGEKKHLFLGADLFFFPWGVDGQKSHQVFFYSFFLKRGRCFFLGSSLATFIFLFSKGVVLTTLFGEQKVYGFWE